MALTLTLLLTSGGLDQARFRGQVQPHLADGLLALHLHPVPLDVAPAAAARTAARDKRAGSAPPKAATCRLSAATKSRQPSAPPPSPGPYPSSAPTHLTAERPPEAACRCMAVPAGSASRLHLLRPPGPPCVHCTCSTVHRAPCRLFAAFHPPGAAAEPAEHAAPLGHRVLPRGK